MQANSNQADSNNEKVVKDSTDNTPKGICPIGSPMYEFEITVPMDYDHDTQIENFRKRVIRQKSTYDYDKRITGKRFAKATTTLVPGKTYKVKLFRVYTKVSSEYCLAFLQKQQALLVGMRGITLMYDLLKDKCPFQRRIAAFDTKENLWKDGRKKYWIPSMYQITKGGYTFNLENWDYLRTLNFTLVGFFEIE